MLWSFGPEHVVGRLIFVVVVVVVVVVGRRLLGGLARVAGFGVHDAPDDSGDDGGAQEDDVDDHVRNPDVHRHHSHRDAILEQHHTGNAGESESKFDLEHNGVDSLEPVRSACGQFFFEASHVDLVTSHDRHDQKRADHRLVEKTDDSHHKLVIFATRRGDQSRCVHQKYAHLVSKTSQIDKQRQHQTAVDGVEQPARMKEQVVCREARLRGRVLRRRGTGLLGRCGVVLSGHIWLH